MFQYYEQMLFKQNTVGKVSSKPSYAVIYSVTLGRKLLWLVHAIQIQN